MKPTMTMCSQCCHYSEASGKATCDKVEFVMPIGEGRISVPYDWECGSYEVRK